MTVPLVAIEGLAKEYRVGRTPVHALRGVDLRLERGDSVAVVGESGSGKTTLANLVLGLERPSAGTIRLDGEVLPPRGWPRRLRRRVQLVAQNPQLALNPKLTIYQSVALPLRVHGLVPRRARRERTAALLATVGLPDTLLDRFPQTLSGGQRQRVALARAVASEPDLLVLDEPTSALDVSVQARILHLLQDLRGRFALSYLFITHDLGVVRLMANRVVVMLRGRVVEAGPTDRVFTAPGHRYTQMLIASIPVVTPEEEAVKPPWPWERDVVADIASSWAGCPFRTRCAFAVAPCATLDPPMRALAPGHEARCHNPGPGGTPTP